MKIQHFYVNPAIGLSGTTPSIISNTETRSGEITRQDASLTVWLSQADQTEVRSWWWRWVSLQLFGLSPWDLCPLWSRHRAAGLTLGHTLYAAWIPCWTPPASHLTPHHLMSLLLSLAAHPSHPWSIIPGYCEQIILKIVHCNWPRTLARLSYLNISTKHVWNRTLTGTFCKCRAERRKGGGGWSGQYDHSEG